MNTLRIIRDPNRPLQFDRVAYAQVMQLLKEAEVDLLHVEGVQQDQDTLFHAQRALRAAIDALRQEAEAE